MTTRQFVAIEKTLVPELPGFAIKGSLIFARPIKEVLRGINFEGSGFDKTSFYVTVFALPLCVPTTHLYFLIGNRLRIGGADRWNSSNPDELAELGGVIKRDAVPFLSAAESLLGFVELAQSFSGNPHTPKLIAFALARAGRFGDAISVLDQLLPHLDLKVEWQSEIAELAKTLRAKLVSDPEEAQQQLKAWEAESLRNLALESFR
jgi:hypothetical protein